MPLTPTAQYRKLIKELLQLHTSLDTITLLPTHKKIVHLAHGWMMRVVRGVEATLALEAKGLDHVAAPIRRSIVEHTVALSWLVEVGNDIAPTIQSGNRAQTEKIMKALEDAGWDSVDRTTIDEILAEPELSKDEKTNDYLLHFTHCAKDYGTPSDVAVWIAESGRSHPRWDSARDYFNTDSGKALARPPVSLSQPDAVAPFLLQSLIYMNKMLADHPWTDVLDAASIRVLRIDKQIRIAKGMTITPQYAEL